MTSAELASVVEEPSGIALVADEYEHGAMAAKTSGESASEGPDECRDRFKAVQGGFEIFEDRQVRLLDWLALVV